jgi:hypothetical protein
MPLTSKKLLTGKKPPAREVTEVRLLSLAIVFVLLLTTAASQAQKVEPGPAPTANDEPSVTAPKPKAYFVSPENMLMRCKVPAFLQCMKWQESECVAVIDKAVTEGNTEVEGKAASKSEAETSSDFFKGYALGVVIGKIHAASKGRLLGCMSAGQT